MKFSFLDSTVVPLRERPFKIGVSNKLKSSKLEEPSSLTSTKGDFRSTIPNSVTMMYHASLAASYPPSKSIPIAKAIKRTTSELQLMEDEATAEYRDYCMYTRIVNGLHEQRYPHPEAVNSIIRTRHLPVQEVASSYQEDFQKYSLLPLESASRLTDQFYFYEEEGPLTIEEPEDVIPEGDEEEGVFVMDL